MKVRKAGFYIIVELNGIKHYFFERDNEYYYGSDGTKEMDDVDQLRSFEDDVKTTKENRKYSVPSHLQTFYDEAVQSLSESAKKEKST